MQWQWQTHHLRLRPPTLGWASRLRSAELTADLSHRQIDTSPGCHAMQKSGKRSFYSWGQLQWQAWELEWQPLGEVHHFIEQVLFMLHALTFCICQGSHKFMESQSKKHTKGCKKNFYIIFFSKQDSAEITGPQVGSQSEKEPIDQTIVVKRVFGWDAPSDVARLACFSYFAWRAIASFQSGGFLCGASSQC